MTNLNKCESAFIIKLQLILENLKKVDIKTSIYINKNF